MQWRIFRHQFWIGLKLNTRNRAALFWLFAFPSIMLLGLGLILNGSATKGASLVWAQSASAAAPDAMLRTALGERGLTVEILNPAAAEARWREGKLPALLEGQDGHYSLRVNTSLQDEGMQIEALTQESFLIAQARARGGAEPARMPVTVSRPGVHHGGPYAAYLLPGLMGLNLLMMGVFSTGMGDVTMRDKGGYKRLATTPLPRHVYLAAQVCIRLVVVTVSAALLMLTGAVVFGIYNQGSYLSLLALLMLGAACFISLGYVLASFARSVDAYNGIANLIYLPLMVMSGVFFSLDAAPAWLRYSAEILPLAPLLNGLRGVFNDGAGLASQAPALGIIAVWTLLLFGCATWRFKWI
jgi:ABC-type multidrug transport system permease subunit